MNKTHRLMVAGIGAMTPAFIATDQLQARAAEGAAIGLAQSGRPAGRAILLMPSARKQKNQEEQRGGGDEKAIAAGANCSR